MQDLARTLDIAKTLALTENEKTEIEYKEENGLIHWGKELEVNLEFSPETYESLRSILRSMDEKKQFDSSHLILLDLMKELQIIK